MVDLGSQKLDCLLRPLALGDVAGNLRGADAPARRTSYRRHAERNLDQASILAPANGFIMVDALAAPHALEDAGLLVPALRRNQHRDRLADGLLGRIPEEPLCALVPAPDDPIDILAQH